MPLIESGRAQPQRPVGDKPGFPVSSDRLAWFTNVITPEEGVSPSSGVDRQKVVITDNWVLMSCHSYDGIPR